MSEACDLFPNPHFLEPRFWTLPSACFHWDTTHAAASFPGREVQILKQLLCFKRAIGLIVFGTVCGTQGTTRNTYIIDNKQFMWCPEGDLNCRTPPKTNKLLKTMRATNARNCRYAVIWYVLGIRPFVLICSDYGYIYTA